MPKLIIAGIPVDDKWRELDPRVIAALREAGLLIAEEQKSALRLLAATEQRDKQYILINEHSTDLDRVNAIHQIEKIGTAVLVSDAGTPCIADPDYRLVDLCIKNGYEITAVPGPSSITTAISVSGFDASRFNYMGFPPREGEDRRKFFQEILNAKVVTVFLERPYALKKTLEDLKPIKRLISLSVNLGGGALNKSGDELNIRGYVHDVASRTEGIKGAFVVVVDK